MQRDDRSPEFYAGGRVSYGPDNEPIMYEGAGEVIAESKARKETLLVFVPLKDVERLTALVEFAQTDVIGNNGRMALVAVTSK